MRAVSRAEQRESTRAGVLEAAEGLFLSRGFETTTVRDIADAAGVSVGTVMGVGDKGSLLAAVFDRGIALVEERRRAVAASRGFAAASVGRIDAVDAPSTVDRIVALVEPYATLFAGRIDLARAYGAVLMTGQYGEVVFGTLADALRAEIEREIRATPGAHPDPAAAAHACYLAYMGALFVWAGSGVADTLSFLAEVRAGVAAIVREGGRR